MTSRWFGASWGARVCLDTPHAPTPVGEPCLWCGEPFVASDQGVLIPFLGAEGQSLRGQHVECAIRSVVGGLNHQRGQCICCGGRLPPDPPDLPKRVAARIAAAYAERTAEEA